MKNPCKPSYVVCRFLGCRLFLNNIYLSIQALAALFCKTNVIFYKIQTLQNFVSLCNQTAVKICELFYEIFSIKLGFRCSSLY